MGWWRKLVDRRNYDFEFVVSVVGGARRHRALLENRATKSRGSPSSGFGIWGLSSGIQGGAEHDASFAAGFYAASLLLGGDGFAGRGPVKIRAGESAGAVNARVQSA